jgi:hypothetical protein
MSSTSQKSFLPTNRDVRYLNRDFSQLKESLLNLAKVYYPNSYKDFSESSPGMMFIDMASYVGDVLSYYTDQAFKEGVLDNANDRRNIVSLVSQLGYKVKPTRAASTTVDVYQLIPAKLGSDGDYIPDNDYALSIRQGMMVSNNRGMSYITNESVNFAVDSILSPLTYTVYSRDDSGIPQFFLLQKSVKATAGEYVSRTYTLAAPSPFTKIYLDELNVLGVDSVYDSDNNRWHEVDYLAQELVQTASPNEPAFEGELSQYNADVPYLISYLRTSRRFTVNVDEDNRTYLEFGSGTESFEDEVVNLSSQAVGAGLSNIHKFYVPYDPNNFLCNQSYGIAPANTTLTVKYVTGGGMSSNCPSNDIRNVASVEYDNSTEGLTSDQASLLNLVKNSIKVDNSVPATGGKDEESNDEIKANAKAFFASQNRSVTKDDYLVRLHSMPGKYGIVAKAFVATNNSVTTNVNKLLVGTVDANNVATVVSNSTDSYFRKISYDVNNPFAINLYVLSYDANKNLTTANDALITNIIKYLKGYRLMTDGINIIDGYIINIGVDFSVVVYKGFNKKDVLVNCLSAVKDFFDIDNWGFQQPINLSQLQLEIAKVEGVQSVVDISIKNLTIRDGDSYSPVEYDIASATKNGIVYSSKDPSVFEVKYPDKDIRATVM